MLARFLKFISHNPLAATIVGTIIGGWILAQLLAMKAPDVGGVLGAVGRWLRAPAGSTRIDEITLALVAILFGFLSCTALFLRQFSELRRREQQPTPEPPIHPSFVPDENQKKVLKLMLHMWKGPLDLRRACYLIQGQRTRVEVAQDMFALTVAGVITTRHTAQNEWYDLTNAGVVFAQHHTSDTTLP